MQITAQLRSILCRSMKMRSTSPSGVKVTGSVKVADIQCNGPISIMGQFTVYDIVNYSNEIREGVAVW